MPAPEKTTEPYCGNCGHLLTGLVDSARCPECGRPIVDVLTRAGARGRRYRSAARLFGLPVIDVAYGPAPGERFGRARGILALGDRATGVVAVGGVARGVVAVGGMAFGICAIGGIAVGLLTAWGGLALAALANGGLSAGILAMGGLALGFVAGGGMAVGWHAIGGAPIGVHTIGPGGSSAVAQEMLAQTSFFFGPSSGAFSVWHMIQPLIVTVGVPLVITALVAIAVLAVHRGAEGEGEGAPP